MCVIQLMVTFIVTPRYFADSNISKLCRRLLTLVGCRLRLLVTRTTLVGISWNKIPFANQIPLTNVKQDNVNGFIDKFVLYSHVLFCKDQLTCD